MSAFRWREQKNFPLGEPKLTSYVTCSQRVIPSDHCELRNEKETHLRHHVLSIFLPFSLPFHFIFLYFILFQRRHYATSTTEREQVNQMHNRQVPKEQLSGIHLLVHNALNGCWLVFLVRNRLNDQNVTELAQVLMSPPEHMSVLTLKSPPPHVTANKVNKIGFCQIMWKFAGVHPDVKTCQNIQISDTFFSFVSSRWAFFIVKCFWFLFFFLLKVIREFDRFLHRRRMIYLLCFLRVTIKPDFTKLAWFYETYFSR